MLEELKSISSSRWNLNLASHLLNRAGFGVPHSQARELAQASPEQAVNALVEFTDDPPALDGPPDDQMPPELSRQELREKIKDLPFQEKRNRRQEWRRKQRRAVRQLIRPWWLKQMVDTPNPLQEKLALFWHGHFATSARKVRNAHYNLQLNQIFRRNAAGNFRELTRAVGKSPMMLRYLDNFRSRKKNPNENWARELLELFTMGLGNYTEKDMSEAARAFTGWTIEKGGSFTYRDAWHDDGKKTFLGETGTFDGDDIIDIVFEQPETARFIVRNLWEYFVYPSPEKPIVNELAALLRLNDYELRPVLRRMFRSKAFYSKRARGALVKSPVQFVVGLYGEFQTNTDGSINTDRMNNLAKQLGQKLFFPPDVSGWDGHRSWIDTNKLLNRYNTLSQFVQNGKCDRTLQTLLKKVDGKPYNEVIRSVEQSVLPLTLDRNQRKELAQQLGGTKNLKKSFHLEETEKKQVRSFGQLLLSTAEYQLL